MCPHNPEIVSSVAWNLIHSITVLSSGVSYLPGWTAAPESRSEFLDSVSKKLILPLDEMAIIFTKNCRRIYKKLWSSCIILRFWFDTSIYYMWLQFKSTSTSTVNVDVILFYLMLCYILVAAAHYSPSETNPQSGPRLISGSGSQLSRALTPI